MQLKSNHHFSKSYQAVNMYFITELFSDYPPLSLIPKSTVMAGLVPQETAEYYKWLIRIEHAEFEKELLDIVSDNFFLFICKA